MRATAVTHLRVAARSLGHGTGLSRSEYAEYRTFAADAPPLAVVERAFGSWPGALAAAGLVRSGPRSRRFSDADLLDGLRDAAAHTAGPLSLAAYERYRGEGALVELGSAQTAIARFGSWRGALALAGLHTPRPPAADAAAIATALRAFAAAGDGTSCAAYRRWRGRSPPRRPGTARCCASTAPGRARWPPPASTPPRWDAPASAAACAAPPPGRADG